jgi:hypothetical protein
MDKQVLIENGDKKALKLKLKEISELAKELEYDLKQCKERRDRPQEHRIRKELRVLANKAKHIRFKLGEYKYPEGEVVEFQPGEFMDANMYHWLKD